MNIIVQMDKEEYDDLLKKANDNQQSINLRVSFYIDELARLLRDDNAPVVRTSADLADILIKAKESVIRQVMNP